MKELNRILLVEDDSKDIELALIALGQHKLANDVNIVRDGEQALDYLYRRGEFKTLSAGNPCVILLDLKMPKVDGLEVLRRMRADENLRMIPVVVLASSREERDAIESHGLGVNAYIMKPLDFHKFVEAIKETGLFWAIHSEEPPESTGKRLRRDVKAAHAWSHGL